eukprot:gene9757-10756_t
MNNSNTANQFQYTINCASIFTHAPIRIDNDLNPGNKLHFTIAAYINIAVALPTAFLNLSLITTFIKLRLYKTVSNIPLIFLATSDFLTSILGQLLFGVYLIQMTKRQLSCGLALEVTYCGITFHVTSSTIVLFITVERYLALFYAFFWASHVTRRHVTIPLSLAWVPGLLLAILFFDVKYKAFGSIFYTVFTITSLIVITVCCVKIFKHIRRMQRSVAAIEIDRESDKRKQVRLAKYCAMVVGVFLLVNIPYSIMGIVLYTGILGSIKSLKHIQVYMLTFNMFISLLNPIVYAWQCPAIGRGMLELWRMRNRQSLPHNSKAK